MWEGLPQLSCDRHTAPAGTPPAVGVPSLPGAQYLVGGAEPLEPTLVYPPFHNLQCGSLRASVPLRASRLCGGAASTVCLGHPVPSVGTPSRAKHHGTRWASLTSPKPRRHLNGLVCLSRFTRERPQPGWALCLHPEPSGSVPSPEVPALSCPVCKMGKFHLLLDLYALIKITHRKHHTCSC